MLILIDFGHVLRQYFITTHCRTFQTLYLPHNLLKYPRNQLIFSITKISFQLIFRKIIVDIFIEIFHFASQFILVSIWNFNTMASLYLPFLYIKLLFWFFHITNRKQNSFNCKVYSVFSINI